MEGMGGLVINKPQCILLAEDDRFLCKAAAVELRRHGFSVLTGCDGEEALKLAREQQPDLILLDLIMPKIQGFEVLRCLKASPLTSDIPVIILSNLGQEKDALQAMEGGAIDFIVKANISLKDLAGRVTKALEGVAK
jgi:DNA-binding response OmpR family regulator